jgi:hypothetical protein
MTSPESVAPVLGDGEVSTRGGGRWLEIGASVVFATLIALAPWEALRGAPFPDVENYLLRIAALARQANQEQASVSSVTQALSGEYLWFVILGVIAKSGLEPRHGLALISWIAALCYHQYVTKYADIVLASLLLLNPIAVDLLASQVRSALAMGLLLVIVAPGVGRRFRWLLLLLPFIHTSMAGVLALYGGCQLVSSSERMRSVISLPVFAMLSSILALAVAGALPSLLELLGDRRADLDVATKSIPYLVFWFVLALILVSGSLKVPAARWEVYFATAILIVSVVLEANGVVAFRLIALSLPVVFAAVALSYRSARRLALTALILYQPILVWYWA